MKVLSEFIKSALILAAALIVNAAVFYIVAQISGDVKSERGPFRWKIDETGATLTGVLDRKITSAQIPAEVDGKPVVAIGSKAFWRCESLETVEFPASLTTIGPRAFGGCKSLRTVAFPENSALTSIGNVAFYSCESLQTVAFPASLTTIRESAFADCSALQTVAFPENSALTTMGNCAFYSCKSLKTVAFPASLRRSATARFSGASRCKRSNFRRV